jgi:hypothetical protein
VSSKCVFNFSYIFKAVIVVGKDKNRPLSQKSISISTKFLWKDFFFCCLYLLRAPKLSSWNNKREEANLESCPTSDTLLPLYRFWNRFSKGEKAEEKGSKKRGGL